jgi:hypothetical protein
MMEVGRTSETLVNVYHTTRCYNPEDSHLRIHRRENLKSYLILLHSNSIYPERIAWNLCFSSWENVWIGKVCSSLVCIVHYISNMRPLLKTVFLPFFPDWSVTLHPVRACTRTHKRELTHVQMITMVVESEC